MSTFPCTQTDALGRAVTLPSPPDRIVSLVPSQTELLAELGLADEVVGLTRFCEHPDGWKEQKTIVGGTKNVNVDRVRALEPDFVLANKEENTRPVVEALQETLPVFVTLVGNVPEAAEMIRTVGALVGRASRARAMADRVEAGFARLGVFPPLRAAYLIWKDPYMTVGGDTFIHDVMTRAGFENVFGERTRYPVVSIDELRTAEPEVVLLSSEPYPFSEEHIDELAPELSGARLTLVRGDLFSWYGSRLLQSPSYLEALRERLARSKV